MFSAVPGRVRVSRTHQETKADDVHEHVHEHEHVDEHDHDHVNEHVHVHGNILKPQ